MAEQYPTLAGGQRLTGTLLRSMLPQTVRKPADTARTATTSRTADPHLSFSVEAGGVYIFDGWIKYSGDTAGDLSLQITPPSGSLGEAMVTGTGSPVVGVNSTPALQTDTQDVRGYLNRTESLDVSSAPSARTFGCLGAAATLSLDIKGTVRVSTTAGTVSLDWAQGTSSATATTLYTDSWLRFRRIA